MLVEEKDEVKEEEQDFESAFNEFSGGQAPPEEEVGEEVAEETPEKVTEEVKEVVEEATTEKVKDEPVDPWQGVPEDLKAQFEKAQKDSTYWQHRCQSDVGRISAYQRQIEDLKKGHKKDEPTQEEVGQAMESPDKWNEFKEEYPEVAAYLEPIRQQVGDLKQSFTALQSQFSPLKEAESRRSQQEGHQRVSEVHSDWVEIVRHPVFDNWLVEQSPGMQSLAQSDDPQDVISLISTFKYWANQQLAQQDAPAKEAGETPASTDAGQSVDAIKQKRAQQLAEAQTVTNRGRASHNAIPEDDFEAAFNFFAKQQERTS